QRSFLSERKTPLFFENMTVQEAQVRALSVAFGGPMHPLRRSFHPISPVQGDAQGAPVDRAGSNIRKPEIACGFNGIRILSENAAHSNLRTGDQINASLKTIAAETLGTGLVAHGRSIAGTAVNGSGSANVVP